MRSTSLQLITEQSLEDFEASFTSHVSQSPPLFDNDEFVAQQQLPSYPRPINFDTVVDPLEFSSISSPPSSPTESKSGSSHSGDSATVATATTDISSSVSQPEPVTTSSPAKCHPKPPPQPNNQACRTPGLKIVIDNIDKTVHPRDQ